jgi:hypothetical protein
LSDQKDKLIPVRIRDLQPIFVRSRIVPRVHRQISFAQSGLSRGEIADNNAKVVLVELLCIQIDANRHSCDFDLEKFAINLTDEWKF